MKKILVVSDSHGEVNRMKEAVKTENPDLIIHLGDCTRDADSLGRAFPSIALVSVPGNCDFSEAEPVRVFEYEGVKIMACHGHTYQVKQSLISFSMAAREKGVRIALYGHTHRVFYEDLNGVIYFNPGSIGAPMGPYPSYGVITIEGETGAIHYDAKFMTDH